MKLLYYLLKFLAWFCDKFDFVPFEIILFIGGFWWSVGACIVTWLVLGVLLK